MIHSSSRPALARPAARGSNLPMPSETRGRQPGSVAEVAAAFLKLGLTSFGGPSAHIGFLRAECVVRRSWLDEEAFADLVALCQFLPGPASSQLVLALGLRRAGPAGAVAASVCFTAPSAALMILFGYGVAAFGGLQQAGWLAGLKLAAVALVAHAVWGMGRSLCPDRPRLTLCLGAAALLLALPSASLQIGVLAGGALLGWLLYRGQAPAARDPETGAARVHPAAPAALCVFLLLLLGAPLLASATGSRPLGLFSGFYRAGALVFGGGHVILPMLRLEVVPQGWVSDDRFLAGYAAAQAVPGPLFTLSGYLGTVMAEGPHAWLDGLWCLCALFLPSWLLIAGTLPYWHRLRSLAWVRAALMGAHAAVVGILLAALYDPVFNEAVHRPRDLAPVLAAFCALQFYKAPPWAVVLLCAAAGSALGRP